MDQILGGETDFTDMKGSRTRRTTYHRALLLASAISALVQSGGAICSRCGKPRNSRVYRGCRRGVVLEEFCDIGIVEQREV